MRIFRFALIFAAVCSLPFSSSRSVLAQSRHSIRVLIVDGQSGGPYHDWKLTTAIMRMELEEAGIFDVTVATAPLNTQDFSSFHPHFDHYQAILWNLDAPDWPEDLRNQLDAYVKGGGGLVIVHAADNAFPGWTDWNRMIGVGGWRNRDEHAGPHFYFKDNELVRDTSPGKAGNHGMRLPFQVVTRDADNPIMRGLPATWMHAPDELYNSLRGPGENMTILATAYSDPKNHGTGFDEPMVMVIHYGKGRVFHTTMGHDAAALSGVGLMTLIQRGTEWAATGKVTLPVPSNFPTADSTSMRVDIEQMDPDFLKDAASVVRHPAQPAPR
ncbi:MAG TPA: ThuA domain-containing protein [Terracidiphilus sp.]|nr:ThuA domain-containing protein [Terracidiphilus sp.]